MHGIQFYLILTVFEEMIDILWPLAGPHNSTPEVSIAVENKKYS